jgi:hypothetical protein
MAHNSINPLPLWNKWDPTNVTTNLTSHDLVMEIVQNSFIHILYVLHTNIMHWKHIWHKFIRKYKIDVILIHLKASTLFINTLICVKCVFNTLSRMPT